jgi:transcription elongation factor GreA
MVTAGRRVKFIGLPSIAAAAHPRQPPSDQGPRPIRPGAGTLRWMATTRLSPSTYQRLQDELDDLRTRGRVEIARDIEAARMLGDLSENGDYHAAKDSQGKMESRIRQLEAMLKDAELVEKGPTGEVAAGVTVRLRYVGDDEVERYLVGSIEERDAGTAVISPGSPLGQALMGKRAGAKVTYEAPSGHLAVEIVSVGD